MSIGTGVRSLKSQLSGLDCSDPIELSARLTCLLFLFSPIGDWYIQPLVLCLAAAGLLLPGFWRSPWLWVLLATLSAVRALADWPLADNHAYLLVYWCLALFIAMFIDDARVLARNARLLIGLTFALAALQKWFSADFLNNVFFSIRFFLMIVSKIL